MRRLREAPGKRNGSTCVLELLEGVNGSADWGGSHAQLSMKDSSGCELGRPIGARARGGESALMNAQEAELRPADSGGTELERPIITGRDAAAEAATAAGAADTPNGAAVALAAAEGPTTAVQMDAERARAVFLGDATAGSTIERARPREERGGTGGAWFEAEAAAVAAAVEVALAGKDCAVLVAVGLTGLVSALLELEGEADGATLDAAEEDADEAAEEAAALTDTVRRTTVGLGARMDAAAAGAAA